MKGQEHIKVNPRVLEWARTSLSKSGPNAARDLHLTTQRLKFLETGERAPSIDELNRMSKVYKRTVATLLLNRPPEERPLPKDCRTLNSAPVGEFHEKTILAVRKARALASSLIELKNEMSLPQPRFTLRAKFSDDPVVIAGECRKLLRLHELTTIGDLKEALLKYIERVESMGVAVFQISLTQDNLRGFSITDDLVPIVVIKKGGEQPTTKIFTLFHELGHIILNEGGLCDISLSINSPKIEQWCNAFAAELLAPSSELLQDSIVATQRANNQKIWAKKDLEAIGKKFHVSALVVLRRLLSLKLTSSEFYSEKHIMWNRPSFGRSAKPEGRNIPKETITERGRTYVTLAFRAYEQNRIDLKDLSDYLGVSMPYIQKTQALLNA